MGLHKEKVCGAHIAQSVEHFLGKEEVTGSNPVMSSSFSPRVCSVVFLSQVPVLMRSARHVKSKV
eukprot:GDKH01005513.1.p1 GENE.GDKH01005513.1~~GDKH01005513.1.p1  ORF type:complete len:65 (-),score=0.77 GDKH01005513.1:12-206(-)